MTKSKFGKPLCRSIMAVVMMMLSLQAMAYDFSYTHQGKTLYYDITSDNTVAVTYYSSSSSSNNYVSGDVVIPSTVTYNGTTYSVTSIGRSAFSGCSGLTSVTIPNSVTSIEDWAFYGCSSLTSVTIPNSVTSIGDGVFEDCSGLTSINVASGNTHYSSIDGVLYNYVQNTLIQCPGAKTSVTIPNSITYIGELAFSGCRGLTSVTIPNSVTSIGRSAFSGCSGLTSVTIGTGVTSIGGGAFAYCSGLTSVTIPNSVTSIGNYAFDSCSGLTTLNFNAINYPDITNSDDYFGSYPFAGAAFTTVNIGDSVQRIPANIFRYCSNLTTLNFNAINCHFQRFTSYTLSYCPFDDIPLTTVNIGDRVQRIPNNFVRGCSGLTSVTIGNSVTSIGDSAFYGCSGLTSVTIPTGVTSIGGYVFRGCNGLTSVTIPNSVTSIGGSAFYDCSGLTSVTIPNSVTSIGGSAFYGCGGLTTLNFNAINCQDFDGYTFGTSLTTVNIGDSVQQIPAYFARGCSGLASVTIPNSVTSIGNDAFSGCGSLTSVTIPNSVTSIGYEAFYGCSGLTSVTIGNRVTSIGDRAFYECLNLSSLISSATVPPTIGNEAFPYPNICTVTVPCGSLAAYTASTCYWSVYFPQRITESSSFELSVSANDEAYGRVEVENHSCESKTLTAIANDGYEFTGWNDGNTENPRTVTVTSDTAFVAIFTEAVSTPTITVTVNDATMGSASYTMDGNTAILTATANEGYRFLTWNDGNMENPRTVTITSDTTFTAIFTASGSSSLQEVNAREFALYPNPAKSFVTLEFEALEENTLLQILDINGRRVRTFDLKAGQETLRIYLGDLPKGVYTIMLGNMTKKLIVE